MAQKGTKKTTKASSSKSSSTTVTRIKASDSPAPKAKSAKKAPVAKSESSAPKKRGIQVSGLLRPFIAAREYFKGAWYELKQVRWPTRAATWSMTGAVLAFTAFFAVFILLLDAAFKYLFETILK